MIKNICDRIVRVNSYIFIGIEDKGTYSSDLYIETTNSYWYEQLQLLKNKGIIEVDDSHKFLFLTLTDKGKQIRNNLIDIIKILGGNKDERKE